MTYPTNPIYKYQKDLIDPSKNCAVQKHLGGDLYASIPFIPGNKDYDEFKAWVDAGNTAEAAD